MDKFDLLLILREMATQQCEHIDLPALRRQTLPKMTTKGMDARIMIFAHALGISGASRRRGVEDLLAALTEFRNEEYLQRSLVLESLVRHENTAVNSDELAAFKHRVEQMLSSVIETQNCLIKDCDLDLLIRSWGSTLLNSSYWNRIESPVPGVADLPLNDTWVNLTLRQFDPIHESTLVGLETAAWNELQFDQPEAGHAPREMLLGVRGLTVVMGPPGAGKSTLVKWLSRYVVMHDDCPFGMPVFVSLRQFAKEKARYPHLTLLEHFLHGQGITGTERVASWKRLLAKLLEDEQHETLLWLLDGWDEVPPDMRYEVMSEIQYILPSPMIMTTRYSAEVLRLPADRFFEIQGLKHQAALQLAEHWLNQTGRSEYYLAIESALEESSELRRMARSPFLLTLMCALLSTAQESGIKHRHVKRNRSLILGQTLDLIYKQHNHDNKQSESFSRNDHKMISRFAFWMLSEASDAPRYLFDESDFTAAGGQAERFKALLVPSRLIARPSVNTSDYQFLHATFQEFLASQHLKESTAEKINWGELFLNNSWKEVLRFFMEQLDKETASSEALWNYVTAAAKNLDPFGLIAARIALLLSAAGATDGGIILIGMDIRPYLWNAIKQYAQKAPTQPLQAYLQLDAQDFARRVLDERIETGRNTALVSFLQYVSVFDLELLRETKKYEDVLALPEVATFCSGHHSRIATPNDHFFDEDSEESFSRFLKLLTVGDMASARTSLLQLIEYGNSELAISAVDALAGARKRETIDILLEVIKLDIDDDLTRGTAVRHLCQFDESRACRALMSFVAALSADDNRLYAIIGNLSGHLLSREDVDLLTDLLACSAPDMRSAIVNTLRETRSFDVSKRMILWVQKESDESVRLDIWSALEELADPHALTHLWQLREHHSVRANDHAAWFRAVLACAEKRQSLDALGTRHGLDQSIIAIRAWAQRSLEYGLDLDANTQERACLPAVLDYPHILGASAVKNLVSIAKNRASAFELRANAIKALAKVPCQEAVDAAVKLVNRKSISAKERAVVYNALGELSPSALAKLESPEAMQVKATLAFRRDILFLPSMTLDSSGRSMNQPRMINGNETSKVPHSADVAIFTALKEEFAQLKKVLSRRAGINFISEPDGERAFTYWGGQMATSEGPLAVVAVCAHQMGPTLASNVATRFIDQFSPRAVVVIGIAGTLSRDLVPGDVLVPSQVTAYFENSAAVDAEQSFELQLSGNAFEVSQDLLNKAREFANQHADTYNKWLRRCKQRTERRLKEKHKEALQTAITRAKPDLLVGDHHLATGPTVGKSAQFAGWLRKHDRKSVAMEMETAGVFQAVSTMRTPCPKLAIRGISDFSDDRKSLVEEEFNSAFRSISMENALDLFVVLAQHGVFSQSK